MSSSKVRSATSQPHLAIEPPAMRPFLEGSVVEGGGVVVEASEAEALIWADPHDAEGLRRVVESNPQLSWIQLPFAGVDRMADVMDANRVWTSAKGAYGKEVAEHALGLALAGMRQIAKYARAKEWTDKTGRSLFGQRVTILGAGGLTDSLVDLLEPFEVHLNVLRRSKEPYERADFTGTLDDLSSVLPETDLLFLTLALTPLTTGVIDAARLDELPAHAWIVNVARGPHIVTDDLVAALRNGSIGGAALDVTDPEPLPSDHPLWDLPNCIITPHTANTPEMAVPTLSKRITENVQRFARGEDLIGLVDIEAGF